MTRLALIRIEDSAVLSTAHIEGRGHVDLPGAGRVSPPQAGWEGGGELVTTEGPPRFRLLPIVQADDPPEGKQRVGAPVYTIEDGQVIESYDLEDIPEPPPEPTRAEKFEALAALAGLTPEDLADEIKARTADDGKAR